MLREKQKPPRYLSAWEIVPPRTLRVLLIGGWASHHEEFEAIGSFLLPCAATEVSLLAVW
jgi:hypothetical protein